MSTGDPSALSCVIPSRLAVGEPFDVKVKVLGDVHAVGWECFAWGKARQKGPFNRNARNYQYCDDILPAWTGRLTVDGDGALEGPREIVFDGAAQGVFVGDRRPVRCVTGFRWTRPGFHFLRLRDPVSGVEALSNPAYVSADVPRERLYWGDPHWQTYFSDGLRCPEELYTFARDEAFLDFGALSDHVEAITDRQWDYMAAVTNDFNQPGRFATLIGQEWTNFTHGHRNIYYPGADGPALRANDPATDTLDKLWAALDGREALVIPHHSANVTMGVPWELGWNPRYERAVEIYSEWGSSERHADDGNLKPIHHCKGEMRGRHVIDALRRGYRFGFVGGGDIHDGRPGDGLARYLHPTTEAEIHPKGLTAAWAPSLTRSGIYGAIHDHRTYATCQKRIYLEVTPSADDSKTLSIRVATEDGLREVHVVHGGRDILQLAPGAAPRSLEQRIAAPELAPGGFYYVRVRTGKDDFAWSSPIWGPDVCQA